MTDTLSVKAIENGCVLDHIPAGQAINILKVFRDIGNKNQMTLGLNLKSGCLGLKDIIKIENMVPNEKQLILIAVFAPNATVNIINHYQVVNKFRLQPPEVIEGGVHCQNSRCITHSEPVNTVFYIKKHRDEFKFQCKYCEKVFSDIQL